MGHVCKWNDYVPNLLGGLENMKVSENYVDATLICEGNAIKVHKLVLSTCSMLFHNMFLSNPCAHPIILLHDMKFSVLRAIIDFMYRGEIAVHHDDLELLLKAAKALEIKGLSSICKDTMLKVMINDIQNESDNDTTRDDSSPESIPPLKRPRKQSLECDISVETSLKIENESEDGNGFNPQITETCSIPVSSSSLPSGSDSLPLGRDKFIKIAPKDNSTVMNIEEPPALIKEPLRIPQSSRIKIFGENYSSGYGRTKKKSFVWNYFKPYNDYIATCSLCPKTTYLRSQLSSMKKHLSTKHSSLDIFKTLQNQDTDASDSRIDQEQQPETKTDPAPSNRKKTSPIWKYFTPKEGMMAECNTCLQKQSYSSSISNLKKHLMRRHPSIYFQGKEKDSDENEDSTENTEETSLIERQFNEKLRKKTSVLWHFFTPLDDSIAECNICLKSKSYRSSISNLKKHLTKAHPSLDLTSQKLLDLTEKQKFQQQTVAPETQEAVIAAMNEQEAVIAAMNDQEAVIAAMNEHQKPIDVEVAEEESGLTSQNAKGNMGKRTSYLWEYFIPLNSEVARCKVCFAKKSFRSSISNLKKHLLRAHPSVDLPSPYQDFHQRFKPRVPLRDSQTSPQRLEIHEAITMETLPAIAHENSSEVIKNTFPELVKESSQEVKREGSQGIKREASQEVPKENS